MLMIYCIRRLNNFINIMIISYVVDRKSFKSFKYFIKTLLTKKNKLINIFLRINYSKKKKRVFKMLKNFTNIYFLKCS